MKRVIAIILLSVAAAVAFGGEPIDGVSYPDWCGAVYDGVTGDSDAMGGLIGLTNWAEPAHFGRIHISNVFGRNTGTAYSYFPKPHGTLARIGSLKVSDELRLPRLRGSADRRTLLHRLLSAWPSW